jgi:parallel beta-helix repeat protein
VSTEVIRDAGPVRSAGTRPASPGFVRRLWDGLRFRDVFLFSLLPLVGVLLMFGAAYRDYVKARQFDDWWSNGQSLHGLFSARVRAILAVPKSLSIREGLSPEARDAGVLRLEIPKERWDSLEKEPDGEWSLWLDADLRNGTTVTPVKVRKRGDNSIHWLTDKRTLTVRTDRDDFFKGYRSFGLLVKDVVPAHLANGLAREFGILAPATAVVPVFLNGRYFGIYRFVEPVDESFLRPVNRMPGNIFRGDAAERGEYLKGQNRSLFANPTIWNRVAFNDRWTSAGPGQLLQLLGDMAGGTFEDHLRMMNRLDRDEYGRLFAYLLFVGDPFHMDDLHNQFLYEDPSTQKLHPIPWDIRLRDLAKPEKPLSALFRAVLRDPFVADSAMLRIAERMEGSAFLKVADSLVRAVDARYGPYIEYDRLRTGLVPPVGDADEAVATLRRNEALLRKWLDADTVAFAAGSTGGTTVLDFETRGFVGANLTGFRVIGAAPASIALRLDENLDGTPDAGDRAVQLRAEETPEGRRFTLAQPLPLYAAWDPSGVDIRPGHMHYRLFAAGLPAGAELTPILTNRATGRASVLAPWGGGSGGQVREGTAWHPWKFAAPTYKVHRYAGTVTVNETVRIPAGDTLIIEPGTTLLLGPDVSIVSRGRVIAQGTAERPIRVLPTKTGVPWGAFTVLGHSGDSSLFKHVEFVQGGGGIVDRIEYIGMVNVHHADGVVFDAVTFRENLRCDDTFHALHARVYVRNSFFIRGNSDALDMDIATGEITNNVFIGSGGDAVDLMTSTPYVAGNRISGSGDKGISVGEASKPFVFNNMIDSCSIGIEVKDHSEPIILHNRITRSGTGLRERLKNWRYGGGSWSVVVQSSFENNAKQLDQDAYSRLTLAGAVGIDTAATVVDAASIAWLYRIAGIVPPADATPGALTTWGVSAPVRPIDQQTFRDDFAEVSDGWTMGGGMTRLEKRLDVLVMEVDRGAGFASRTVNWALPTGGTLVLEAMGRDLAGSRIVVRSGSAEIARDFTASPDPAVARFIAVELPAGRYDSVSIHIDPVPGLTRLDPATGLTVSRGGRLDLRGYRVVPGR